MMMKGRRKGAPPRNLLPRGEGVRRPDEGRRVPKGNAEFHWKPQPAPNADDPHPARTLRRPAAVLALLPILLALSGCEYFTSERLGRLKPNLSRTTDETETEAVTKPVPTDAAATADAPASSMTAADMVALMERIIRGNQRELEELQTMLVERGEEDGEESRARDVFQTLDDLTSGLNRERKKAEAEGRADRVADIDRQLEALKRPWELARARLNLDLRARTLMIERVGILQAGIAHDQRRLAAIIATGDPAAVLSDAKVAVPADVEAQPPAPTEAPAPTPTKAEAKPEAETPQTSGVDAQSLLLGVPAKAEKPATAEPGAEPSDEAKTETAAKTETTSKTEETKDGVAKTEETKTEQAVKKPSDLPPSKELVTARRELQVKSSTVQRLQERTMTLDARIKSIARSIEILEQLASIARESMEKATETRAYLINEMKEGKPSVALQAWTKAGDDPIGRMDQRIKEARENAETFGERHELLVEERAMVESALRTIAQRAREARETLDKAQETVEALESPFSSHYMLQWLRHNGPPILGTLLVMTLLYLGVTRYSHKIIQIFAKHGMRGSKSERDNRMETLVSVLKNTGGALVLVGGVLTLLGQIGVPVGPLLGGAAVAGVAVAFGAQNLIKDFFYGFMILLENQYKLNDVVKIGDHSGAVEQITLRMTALRDMEGALHFLPNGATTSVVNMTHGWSRALFYVRIGIGEDVERVIGIIQDLGKEFRQDPAFRLTIVDDLTMLGVDNMTESAITLVFFIKTLPVKQWDVKREFLKRLKKRFEQHGVVLPPPFVINPPS